MSSIKINYIEIQVGDIKMAKKFYGETFGWTFKDFGPDYCAFNDGETEGGFSRTGLHSSTENGGVLVVLYAEDLEATQDLVVSNGGRIVKDIFSFPGGRRFQFADPGGNELAVWSDK